MTLKTLTENSFNGFRKTHSDDFKRTNTLELKKLEEEFQLKRDSVSVLKTRFTASDAKTTKNGKINLTG